MCLASFAQQSNNFEIKFNINGICPKNVSVSFFGEKDVATNDLIGENRGEFVFSGYTPSPIVARLSFSGEDRFLKIAGRGFIPYKSSSLWLIVYPGAKFSVDGSLAGKDFVDLYPKDGSENDIFARLNSNMMPLFNEMGNATLRISLDSTLSTAQIAKLESEINELGKKLNLVKVEFLNENANSLAALWLMEDMLIRSEIKPEELVPFMERVDIKKYGNDYFYKAVNNRIDGSFTSAVGQPCPSIVTDATPDGSTFDIKSLRGKYVIIDFWGTWCGPCVAGIPHMVAFQEKHADKLHILGISNDRSVEVWKSFIEKNNMTYFNIMTGKSENDYVSKFNVQGFPTKILISPEGKILFREPGENESFYTKIEELMGL